MNNELLIAQKRALSMLGLAVKAGKAATGEFAVERSLKDKEASLVILAADASPNTVKKFENICFHYQVPVIYLGDKESLGRAAGKDYRSCAAVSDPGMAVQIKKLTNNP